MMFFEDIDMLQGVQTRMQSSASVQQAYLAMKGWDFGPVENYLHRKENHSLENIAGMKEEYIRFLSLVIGEKTPAPISWNVDPFWHAHVLHTLNYIPFCQNMGTFLHHNPVATEEERLALQAEYDGFIKLYRLHYGDENKKYWGGSDMVCLCCCNGRDITNDLPGHVRHVM